MVKKAVRLDVQHQFLGADRPRAAADGTRVVVMLRCRPTHGKGAKPMGAHDLRGAPGQRLGVGRRTVPRQTEPSSERRTRIAPQRNGIAVPSRRRTEAGVKCRNHLVGIGNPDVVRQSLIQRPAQPVRRPVRRHRYTGRLAAGMNASVRATSTRHPHRLAGQIRQRIFDDPLHGACGGLHLPPGEVATVVLQHELDHALRH